jgi:2-keto-4-pentenoate hydratase/2-oxohepta-3-ene-1,7-dioic acid hydratase in catechol pathway
MTSREIQIRDADLKDNYRGFSRSKGLPTFCPTGKFYIPYQDFVNISPDFKLRLSVNGKIKQNSNLDLMISGPLKLIKDSFLPKHFNRRFNDMFGRKVAPAHNGVLHPGDIFLTGTPSGMLFVAPTNKMKRKAFLYGLKVGRPITGAKDYLVKHQPPHLKAGDKIRATATGLDEINVEIKKAE